MTNTDKTQTTEPMLEPLTYDHMAVVQDAQGNVIVDCAVIPGCEGFTPTQEQEVAIARRFCAAGTRSAGEYVRPKRAPRTAPDPAAAPTPLLIPKGTPLAPGKMYLRLIHGRIDPAHEMDDWGFDGPTFGPLSSYVQTYCSTFRIHAEWYTQELWLDMCDDMIRWDGCFYGDMEVFMAGVNDWA